MVSLDKIDSPDGFRLSAVAEVGEVSSPSMSSSSSGMADSGNFSSAPSSSPDGLDPLSTHASFDFESLRDGFDDVSLPG